MSNEERTEYDLASMLDDIYMDGMADYVIGIVDYGSGHWVFHELDGEFFSLHTNSQGFKSAFQYKDEHDYRCDIQAVEAEYDDGERDL